MSAADKADDDLANDLVLADDDLAAVIDNLLGVFLEFDGIHIVSSGKNFESFSEVIVASFASEYKQLNVYTAKNP